MKTPQMLWAPTDGITRHSGARLSEEMEFFAEPPAELGTVLTADSSLKATSTPMSKLARWFWTGLVVLVTTLIFIYILGPFVIIPTLIAGCLTFLALGFSATCSYVGERGIVEYSVYNSRSATPDAEILIFDDATQLFTQQTRRFRNGVYQGTKYNYRWVRRDQTDMKISGVFRDKTGWPQDDDRWHFANAAESAWTTSLLPVTNRELERSGYVDFPMTGKLQTVRVGRDSLMFVTRAGETQEVMVSDMKDIELKKGAFQFKHRDANWWSGKGWYAFAYGDMPNAKLFLLCLEQVAGVVWS